MSQRTGTAIIVIIVILLNLWLMGEDGGGGRGTDYLEELRYDEIFYESYP